MYFNKFIGIEKIQDKELKVREAVRAVVIRDGQILMVHSNKGDFKFPGGGVKAGETHRAALVREIGEETGYIDVTIGKKFGVYVERIEDTYNKDGLFEMISHYFLCQCSGKTVAQQLEGYEIEQEFTPKWMLVEEVITQNEYAMTLPEHNGWIERENYVLRRLLKIMKTTSF
jgi:8-oxo-dGTP pyrophosphatase MutT (NUDIX family)